MIAPASVNDSYLMQGMKKDSSRLVNEFTFANKFLLQPISASHAAVKRYGSRKKIFDVATVLKS